MRFHPIFLEEVESTNSLLKDMARQGAPLGTAVCAKRQTGGRGRLERSFSSLEGGLYLSLLLPFGGGFDAGLLTTYAAIAVARAVERVFGVEVKIKWVNDLLVGGKKICGILAEGVAVDGVSLAVVGIGVNLYNKLPSELSDIAASLFELCGKKVEPRVLFEALLEEFAAFDKAEPTGHLDEYRHRSAIIGEIITVIPHTGEEYEAKALSVMDDGALLVERVDNGETIRIFGGEVSTKLKSKVGREEK